MRKAHQEATKTRGNSDKADYFPRIVISPGSVAREKALDGLWETHSGFPVPFHYSR
jgi:hypothetical protein